MDQCIKERDGRSGWGTPVLLPVRPLVHRHPANRSRPFDVVHETHTTTFMSIRSYYSQVFVLPVGHLMSYLGIVPKGHFLDVPNAALGILYYSWVLLTTGSKNTFVRTLTIPMALAAFGSTVILAYQLTFVVLELCILCWSTHVINTLLLYKIVLKPRMRGTSVQSKVKRA